MTPERLKEIRERAECIWSGASDWSYLYRTDVPELLDEIERLKAELAEVRDTISSMLMCVGKNSANITDPVEAIRLTYRNLVMERENNARLKAELESIRSYAELVEARERLRAPRSTNDYRCCGHNFRPAECPYAECGYRETLAALKEALPFAADSKCSYTSDALGNETLKRDMLEMAAKAIAKAEAKR